MAEGTIIGRRLEQLERIKHAWKDSVNLSIPGFKGTLANYQSQGVAFLIAVQRGLLVYFVGAGKTPISIAAEVFLRNNDRIKKTLVVGLAGPRWHWLSEYKKFSDLKVKLIDGEKTKRKACWFEAFENYDVSISHYDVIRRDTSFLLTNNLQYDLIVFDEASYFRSRGTEIGKALRQLVRNKHYVWGLTATPIQKRLEDLYWIMNIVNYRVLGSFDRFKDDYLIEEDVWTKTRISVSGKVSEVQARKLIDEAKDFVYAGVKPWDRIINTTTKERADVSLVGKDELGLTKDLFSRRNEKYMIIGEIPRARRIKKVVGSKNIEAVSKVMDPYYLRKTQDDVVEIDRKRVRVPRAVELTPEQKKLYVDIVGGLDEAAKERKSLMERFQALEYACGTTAFFDPRIKQNYENRTQLDMTWFDSCCSSKIDDLIFLLEHELVDEKIVVFSKYRIMLYHLMRVLEQHDIKYTEILGDVELEQREKNRLQFLEDSTVQVCLISTVGEMGLNLHAARYILFLNELYNPARQEQLIGRIDRPHLQQSKIISSIHYYTQDSFEPRLHERMDKERELADTFFGDRDVVEQMSSDELFTLMRGAE